MATASRNKSKANAFSRRYHVALRRYLKQGASAKPTSAARLGGEAVAKGLDILDLALMRIPE